MTLQDFNISYRQNSNTTWIQVPSYNFLTITSWKAKSLCCITCSGSTEQILYSNQTVTLTKSDDTDQVLTGADLAGQYYTCVFMCNKNINSNGMSSVDLTTRDASNNIVYAKFYVYKKQISVTNSYQFNNDNMTLIVRAGQLNSASVSVLLPEGEYIFPVQIRNLETGTVSIKLDGTAIAPIYDTSQTTMTGGMVYPLKVHIASSGNHTLLAVLSTTLGTDLNLLFNGIYKYEPQSNTDTLLRLIKLFDINSSYNYIYKVDSNTEISDPLKAESFLNSNHIFNKRVICQLDTSSNTNLRVS